MPTLATLNVNNFFLRYRFASTYPGSTSVKSAVEAADITMGYVPEKKFGRYASGDFVVWDPVRRELAARALAEPDGRLPDILCLQEVENMDALRKFNEDYLRGRYPYRLLIDGWDPRNIDVAVLSVFPIVGIRSHLDAVDGRGQRILSRDCLEATVRLDNGEELTVFVNHLKSKFVAPRGRSTAEVQREAAKSDTQRLAQAEFVARRVKERFGAALDTALFAVVGDFNDTADSPWLSPLLRSRSWVDVVRHTQRAEERWTYYWRARNRVTRIDFVLASKALAARAQASHIARAGLGYRALGRDGTPLPREVTLQRFEERGVRRGQGPRAVTRTTAETKVPFGFERYAPILENVANNVSDHCPIKVWF